jgi:hypothetical protein
MTHSARPKNPAQQILLKSISRERGFLFLRLIKIFTFAIIKIINCVFSAGIV